MNPKYNITPIQHYLTKRTHDKDSSSPYCAYLYDLAHLREHASYLKATLPEQVSLFYAVKANDALPILNTLLPVVDGFEVASGGELATIRDKFPADTAVVFGGPAKTDAELIQAIESQVEFIHVESVFELTRLEFLATEKRQEVSVLLRLNIGFGHEIASDNPMAMAGKPTPFGMSEEDMTLCLTLIKQSQYLSCRGFHFHLLSLSRDARQQLDYYALCLKKVCQWQAEYQLEVSDINLGGGIGASYYPGQPVFDWNEFIQGFKSLLQQPAVQKFALRLELGRYVTASCGFYLMEVMDIKTNHQEIFVVARGGTHHFRLPAAQSHSHPFEIYPVERWDQPYIRPEISNCKVNVVGSLCTPKDRLSTQESIKKIRVGDILVFPLAGAYAWNISHHSFLKHPAPEQVFLDA